MLRKAGESAERNLGPVAFTSTFTASLIWTPLSFRSPDRQLSNHRIGQKGLIVQLHLNMQEIKVYSVADQFTDNSVAQRNINHLNPAPCVLQIA